MDPLIQAAKHSPDAFCALYDRYSESTYRYVFYRVANKDDAQDIVSIAWEKVLSKIETLQSNEEKVFCGWLFQILRNEITDWYRKKKSQTVDLEAGLEVPDAELNPAQAYAEREKGETLLDLFQTLSPLQQDALSLRFFADMKNAEIARELNLSEDAVASHISRGLKVLRGLLKKLP